MITLQQVAKLIPREYRKKILEGNIIYKAAAQPTDPHFRVLFQLWTTYVDNSGLLDMSCAFCIGNILNNFRELQPILLELEREENLLEEL